MTGSWDLREDTGLRRRRSDPPRRIGELIDATVVLGIAQETWSALIGGGEVLVPLPEVLPADRISAWVEIVGPWTGRVVLTCGRDTATELTRRLLGPLAPATLDHDDVVDAIGELANVLGGNIKGALPGPSVLGLPGVGTAVGPAGSLAGSADVVRLDVLWRGRPLVVSVQGC